MGLFNVVAYLGLSPGLTTGLLANATWYLTDSPEALVFFSPSLIATSFLFLQKKAVSTLLLLIVALFPFTLFFMALRFFLLTVILMVLCQQPSSTQPWTFHYGKFCLLPVWKYSIAIPCQHKNSRNKFQQKNSVCLNLLFISLVQTHWPSPLLFDNKLYRVNA